MNFHSETNQQVLQNKRKLNILYVLGEHQNVLNCSENHHHYPSTPRYIVFEHHVASVIPTKPNNKTFQKEALTPLRNSHAAPPLPPPSTTTSISFAVTFVLPFGDLET